MIAFVYSDINDGGNINVSLTATQAESGDEESDEESEEDGENKFGDACIEKWSKRKSKLEHDLAIAGWFFSVHKDVRADVKARSTPEHREALERVIRRMHSPPCFNTSSGIIGKTMDQIVDLFWDEYLLFEKEQGPFKPARFNTDHALKGISWKWHEKYSLNYTSVLGPVACRVTSKLLGIGMCERNWGDVKAIKTGKRALLSTASTEKRAVLYTTARLMESRMRRNEMESVDAGPQGLICDQDFR